MIFRALGRNVVLKYASEGSRLAQMLFFLIAARRYGAAGLGNLTVLLMIGSGIVLLLGDLGVNTTMIARVSGRPVDEQARITAEALSWKSVLCVLTLLVMCGGMYLTRSAASLVEILCVALVSLGGLWLEFFAALTNAINRFDKEVWLRILYRGAVYGGGAIAGLFVNLEHDLEIMAGITVVATLAASLPVMRLLPIQIRFRTNGAGLLRESVPVWVTQLAQLTYLKFDVVILGLLHVAARETGWYAAGWKVADVLTGVPALLSAAALPLISGTHGAPGLQAIVPRYLKAMYVLPFFLTLPLTIGSGWVTRILYGDGFSGTPRVMSILVWAIVPLCVHTFLAVVAVAVGRQREAAKLAALASILGMSAAAFLIPKLGYEAMAVVSLVANVLFACGMIYRFRDVTDSAHLGILCRSLACAAGAFGIGSFLLHIAPAPLIAAISTVLYGLGLILCGAIKFAQLERGWRAVESMLWRRRVTEEISGSV